MCLNGEFKLKRIDIKFFGSGFKIAYEEWVSNFKLCAVSTFANHFPIFEERSSIGISKSVQMNKAYLPFMNRIRFDFLTKLLNLFDQLTLSSLPILTKILQFFLTKNVSCVSGQQRGEHWVCGPVLPKPDLRPHRRSPAEAERTQKGRRSGRLRRTGRPVLSPQIIGQLETRNFSLLLS